MPDGKLHITLAGREHVVEAGTTAGQVLDAHADAFPDHRDTVIAARVAAHDTTPGQLRDLAWPLADGDRVEPVPLDSPDGLMILRHSTAHVLAQAVQELFPEAKLGIGPPIENGFYYDFDVPAPFTPEDLKAIEKRMREIVKQGQRFVRRVVTDDEARAELADEPYKLELIGLKGAAADEEAVEVGGGELTIYDNLDAAHRRAVLEGPVPRPAPADHPAHPGVQADAHRAARTGGAARRTRSCSGSTAPRGSPARRRTHYLELLAEAERRDHRKLGAELDLFSFPDEIGSGLAVFHPKGGIDPPGDGGLLAAAARGGGLRVRQHPAHHQGGAVRDLRPPALVRATACSRRWSSRAPEYYLKPMNCPMHNLIFRSRGRSYRELPLRLFEFGTVYRYEKSGVVHGLTRVRGLTQDDAHIYCTREQMRGRAQAAARLRARPAARLRARRLLPGAVHPRRPGQVRRHATRTGRRPPTTLRAGRPSESGLELVPDPGGAAFYGPKISVQAKDAIGRTWQMSTIQLDFNLPERFDLEYQAADGTRQQPVMIHRALFGSIERFFGVLIEHYAGAFPPWLAPVQVVGIPITDAHVRLPGRRSRRSCATRGIRVEVDDRDDRMQKKIRNAQRQKVPFMLLAGDDDVAAGRGVLPLPQRRAEATACRSTRRSTRSPPPSPSDARSDARGRRRRDGARGTRASSGVGDAGRASAAVDAAPDGLHQGRGQAAGRRPGRRLPVLPGARAARRGRADRRPRRDSSTRCSTCTRTTPGT